MSLLAQLENIWQGVDHPFFIYENKSLYFSDITSHSSIDLSCIKSGDVVAIIGDFNPESILTLLTLIDLGAIIVPLTQATKNEHEYFFISANVNIVIENANVRRYTCDKTHPLIDELKRKEHAGLILFSTGTTGKPKAILHDLTLFLKKFETPRPTLRTINFLLFDHIGGLNTLFHTLFNKGVVIAVGERTVDSILETCDKYQVEVLPTTPTFLRLMLMSGAVPEKVPSCLKIISYGTERMEQTTLDELCRLLPGIELRQTFGMSELGIVRVKSQSRNSLFMKIGGEGVETKIVDSVLYIRSISRMLGYLNASSPFDSDGWYDTKDLVEEKNGFYKVIGRTNEVINVGGLKFMGSEVEDIVLKFPGVAFAKVYSKNNPITGQHVEVTVQASGNNKIEKSMMKRFLNSQLQPHMVPQRIRIEDVAIGHRFKKL